MDSPALCPGPGVGAIVYYDASNGEIRGLVLYEISNPIPVSPLPGDAALDATNDPNLPALFDEFRSGVSELSWYIDLQTLKIAHR